MWKKGKKRKDDSGDSDSGPPAKLAKTDSDDRSGEIVVCELSKRRRVTVRSWQGKPVVDIREFFVKDGKELPKRKAPVSPSPLPTLVGLTGLFCPPARLAPFDGVGLIGWTGFDPSY
ncbi:RNA polymerase II transcriptional coactivator KIWI [Dendrobium catenatum]|uniref:RNA polymerase II transcriptional coactivator KIWI n=1 Tax=Dendrobium catenatum TaxID=906689 RepID=A0A2I0WC21_9ASPA|nr:RNA polymerase II transcriptional coactivator KIWI [Dendrobium catenatum]